MKITLTQDEARELSRRWLETTIDQNLEIELLPNESFVPRIGPEHKIALIKFARQVADDVFNKRVPPSTSPGTGHLFFGLAEAKKYVETHFGWTA